MNIYKLASWCLFTCESSVKIKQKISGCFRTDGDADDFAKLHSIAEERKLEYNAILAVVQQ